VSEPVGNGSDDDKDKDENTVIPIAANTSLDGDSTVDGRIVTHKRQRCSIRDDTPSDSGGMVDSLIGRQRQAIQHKTVRNERG
jgi:hypothetical protein